MLGNGVMEQKHACCPSAPKVGHAGRAMPLYRVKYHMVRVKRLKLITEVKKKEPREIQ